jgi:hypothetical protein
MDGPEARECVAAARLGDALACQYRDPATTPRSQLSRYVMTRGEY